MFEAIEQNLLNFLLSCAYEPVMFYSLIVLIMTLSTFGLPISEEVVIISAGLCVYMGAHPELYPPPVLEPALQGALHGALQSTQTPVQPITTALVCFLSVFLSDFLVYMLGFVFRGKVINHPLIKKSAPQKRKEKIDIWLAKYGYFVPGLFRFTPGLRFIGYLTCGVVRIPIHKFILVDGSVAFLVVMAQILIISNYGEVIIENLKISVLIVAFLSYTFLITVVLRPLYRIIKGT